MEKKWFILLIMVVVIGMLLSSCSEKSNNANNKDDNSQTGNSGSKLEKKLAEKQVLNLASDADISTMDLDHAQDTYSFTPQDYTRSGLVRYDDNNSIVPDLAASMPKVNKDKTVYTFTLRKNIKWSDGTQVTAQDFVYAWRRIMDPKTAGEYAFIFEDAGIKNADKILDEKSNLFGKVNKLGIKALGKKKLQITLEKPNPVILDMLNFQTFYPLKKKEVEKYGDQYAQSPDKMLFNGPYILTKWKHDQGWTYEKNPKYWNARNIKLQKINVKVVKKQSTRVNLYQTDQLDMTSLSGTSYIGQFKSSQDFHTYLTPTMQFMRLNEQTRALANKHIRKALYNGFDRKAMVNVLLKDGSQPAYYLIPKNFDESSGKDFRSEYPSINKTSLKEAKKSWEKGLKEIGKKSLHLTVILDDSEARKNIFTYLKAQYEKNLPGIKLSSKIQPYGEFNKLETAKNYDLSLSGWVPDYLDAMNYLDMFTKNNSWNRMDYINPQYDRLIQKAKRLGADPEKRFKVMQRAEKVLLDDSAIVPINQAGSAYIKKPYVKNIILRKLDGADPKYAYIVKH